ncbi:uncharacterized protein [Oscarella lobularis]|uniref:uncharacterized protein n=1 Tax=Oscarella lobularis TaxID=121494 RepID=UPI003313FB12
MATTPETKRISVRRNSLDLFGFSLNYFVGDGVYNTVITDVLSRGPADCAGLGIGDRILEIDGMSVSGKTFDEIEKLIKDRDQVDFLVVLRPRIGASLQVSTSAQRNEERISFIDPNQINDRDYCDPSLLERLLERSLDADDGGVVSPPAMAYGWPIRTGHLKLERTALRPRASTPPLVSSPAADPPGVATTERPSTT